MSSDGLVEIHGKLYKTVALRVKEFRADHPDWSIESKLLSSADLVQIKTTIKDHEGRPVANGHAEELRGSTNILKTSAVETCETSSWGRALSALGYGGESITSAEELANALEQQKEMELLERLKDHNACLRDHIESVVAVKAHLLNNEYEAAYEAVEEIPEEDRRTLWIAPSNGGIWTTAERAAMKSNEWTAARKAYHGEGS